MNQPGFTDLKLGPTEAEHIIFQLYGKRGRATSLQGEIDFNFRIELEGGGTCVLKVSPPGAHLPSLDFQQKLLKYLEHKNPEMSNPRVIDDCNNQSISIYIDKKGRQRLVRLLSWVQGQVYANFKPHTDALRYSLGQNCGKLTKALMGFDHPLAKRKLAWDVSQGLWTKDYLHLFSHKKQRILRHFQEKFSLCYGEYDLLRKSVVHNDNNDHNLLVSNDLSNPEVIASIDYGDALYTQIINDVAITCTYAMMGQNNPLLASMPIVKGYNRHFYLQEKELNYLYTCIGIRLVISVTKSAINKKKHPQHDYLQISEDAAWELLIKWRGISEDFACFSFRSACGFDPHPDQSAFNHWVNCHTFPLIDLFPELQKNDCAFIDLSVSSEWLGHLDQLDDEQLFNYKIKKFQRQHPGKIIAGGYLEPRMIYSTDAYDRPANEGNESRTIHLGVDFWLPAGTPVHCLFDGEVIVAVNDQGNKEYGGLIILKHSYGNHSFYSLYGHLSVQSALARQVGEKIYKGDVIGSLGKPEENGHWPPHLHFQLMLSMLDFDKDFPGVAYQSEISIWKGICPDPNLLFKTEALRKIPGNRLEELLTYRNRHIGFNLSLSYKQALNFVRGHGPYLIDSFGKKYLDSVNNVAHVGHEHYQVVKAGQDQMAMLNTNTRYLHHKRQRLIKDILATLPDELNVVYLVNSGSEANELALRMAKFHTGQNDILCSAHGYHGNSNACVEISSYKFDAPGGSGCPEFTQVFPIPDRFRGKYKGEHCGDLYASEIDLLIDGLIQQQRSPAAIIVEPIISCGGQIELPEGFLKKAYAAVRNAGGICISDEVQVGCGRLGKAFWGFELHGSFLTSSP